MLKITNIQQILKNLCMNFLMHLPVEQEIFELLLLSNENKIKGK